MMSIHRLFLIISAAIVGLALVWGFLVAGSPMAQRLERFDERKLGNLETISREIMNIVYEGRSPDAEGVGPIRPVPPTLQDVREQALSRRVGIADPQTGEPYGYRVTGDYTYELCAIFNFQRDQPYDVAWNHPAGRHCFEFDTARPDGTAPLRP
jgi:hypothetical protein